MRRVQNGKVFFIRNYGILIGNHAYLVLVTSGNAQRMLSLAVHNSQDARFLIEHGIEYAKEGYDSITAIYAECPRDEDLEEFIENYLNEWKPVQEKE